MTTVIKSDENWHNGKKTKSSRMDGIRNALTKGVMSVEKHAKAR